MANEEAEIRNGAIRCLARREFGVWELRQKLARKSHDVDQVQKILDTLQADGLLSDQRYAEARAHSLTSRGYGPRRIEMELQDKHVPDWIIAAALNQPPSFWIELAGAVRQKKFGFGSPKDFKEKAKQMRFLQYRGFNPDQIARAVNIDEMIE